MKNKLIALSALICLSTLNHPLSAAHAQGTAFTYQGRLNSGGSPANGRYDLTFTLFSTNTTGAAIAGPVTNSATPVSNGLFTVTLDFGANFPGANRWLAIAVRTNGGGAFTPLTPRQALTPTPYAITAGTATSAGSLAIPPGMVLIPAGPFTMGNSSGDGDITDANPTNVYVSAFYMDVNLVSFSQWQAVLSWAWGNAGYVFSEGSGKAANHPVQTVTWYDCVKWCNARSQQAGLTPVYYTDAQWAFVYTDGTATPYVNWTANGYRLPTEAEWEKAARGGLSGKRFPWGNIITENVANYYGNTNINYDLGPDGYNSIGSIGGTLPATSPVGSFAANGYGLYDMAGNVSEWCWDWYGTPYAGGSDPHGPAGPLTYRVLRGGSWRVSASYSRCANRSNNGPSNAVDDVGFRCVRGL
jgi:formylglycine-generating enzyme required for sulfatase activity